MICRETIVHIPLSEYAFINSETSITIRIRTGKDNLKRCTLYYGDRVYPADPIIFTPVEMYKAASDLYFDFYEVTFESPYTRMCYYFDIEDDEEQIYLYSNIFSKELPEERSEFYQYPFMRREEINTVPEWLKHAVVYNIFPDSFASGKRNIEGNPDEIHWESEILLHSRLGGNIRGIIENLDYIAELGFNCLYLNPVFVAAEYHKYDLLDYYHISPNLGTDKDFEELVEAVHNKGMHIIIDGVFNHCSWYFFAFDDVVKNGERSRYKDWFYDLEFPVIRPENPNEKPNYSCFAYERKMPKLNSSNAEVREYFVEIGRYWIEKFHVDGWRLDVANEVDRDFWRAYKRATREANPESVMIGEIWESAESWLRGDMFDSTMNYDFRKNCRDFFGTEKINAKEFAGRITDMMYRYPTGILHGQLNLLDSHDVSRFMSYCKGDIRRFRLAEVFLFTSPGVPGVFYGDELGMDGNSEFTLRGPMPWNNPISDEREFLQKLITLRKGNEAFVTGSFKEVFSDENGLYIYERSLKRKTITVAINARNLKVALNMVSVDNVLISSEYSDKILGPFGYVIWM